MTTMSALTSTLKIKKESALTLKIAIVSTSISDPTHFVLCNFARIQTGPKLLSLFIYFHDVKG